MKKSMLTGSVIFLLLITFSCTKENTSNTAQMTSQTSDEVTQSANVSNDLNVEGEWLWYYDWYCDGYYGVTTLSLHSDGTWSAGEGSTGHWSKKYGILIIDFDGGYSTIYAGNVYPHAIRGTMTTFIKGQEGCFWMEPASSSKSAVTAQKDSNNMDAAGNK